MFKLPNFLICGTAAGGTSYLTSGLLTHPEIYLSQPIVPEPHFFYKSWEYKKGISYYRKKYFNNVVNEKAIGERSSSYMFNKKVPRRIHKYLPQVKIIFMLRNPIERTYANYRFTVLQGLETLSFAEALKNEHYRVKQQIGKWSEIQPYNYTGRGFYFQQIEQFLSYFKREQILILKSETFGQNLQNDFKKILNFLEVSNDIPIVEPPKFMSLSVKDRTLQTKLKNHFGKNFYVLIEAIRKEEDPTTYLKRERDLVYFHLLKKNLKSAKEDMLQEERSYLQTLFREEIKKLQTLVDFPLDDWK